MLYGQDNSLGEGGCSAEGTLLVKEKEKNINFQSLS